jgi:uncharacterized membrane protein
MQRLFWLALCLVMVFGPGESRAQSQYSDNSYFSVSFVNDCGRRIQTAVHYVDLSGNWATHGWWILDPGQRAFVAKTKNRIFYSYAESIGSTSNRIYWRGNDQSYHIRGSSNPYGFRKRDMNMTNWGQWTERFTCN